MSHLHSTQNRLGEAGISSAKREESRFNSIHHIVPSQTTSHYNNEQEINDIDISVIEKEIQLYGRILLHNGNSAEQIHPSLPHQDKKLFTPRESGHHPIANYSTQKTDGVGNSPAYWAQPSPVYRSTYPITPSQETSNNPWKMDAGAPQERFYEFKSRNDEDHHTYREQQYIEAANWRNEDEYGEEDSIDPRDGDRENIDDSQSQDTQTTQEKRPKNRKSIDRVRQELEEKHQKECTFKPKISRYASTKAKNAATGKERIRMLAQNRKRSLERREEMKKQKEEEELARFPFRPNIKGRKRSNTQDTIERLSREAERRQEMRERARREHEQKQNSQWTFQPRINRSKSVTDIRNYRPIHERVGEVQRQKKEQLHQLRLQKYDDPDLTFAPSINEVSESLAQSRNHSIKFQERIIRELAREKEKKYRMQEMHEHEEFQKHSFRPKLSKNTKRIVQQSSLFQSSHGSEDIQDFLKRQEAYEARNRTRREIDKHGVRNKPKFKPTISATSHLLVESKLERIGETEQDRLQRMAFKNKQRNEALKECIREQYYAQYNFQPEINKISKIIGRPTDLDELVSNERNRQLIQDLEMKAEEEHAKKYRFQPQLLTDPEIAKNSRFRIDPQDTENVMQRIEEIQREKERKIEETKKIMQYEEMQGCTFQPQRVNTRNVDPGKFSTKPVIVPGLGKHMERIERAKKLKEEQEEREKKAFEINSSHRGQNNGISYTIPEPFKLSSKGSSFIADMRRKETEHKWRQIGEKECTFHPRTNAMQVLDFIDDMDDSEEM